MRVKVCNQEKKTKGEKIPFSISSPCDYNVKTKKLPRMTQEFCSTCILFILTVFHKPMTGFRGNTLPLSSAFSLIRVLGFRSDRTKGVVKRERVREMETYSFVPTDSAGLRSHLAGFQYVGGRWKGIGSRNALCGASSLSFFFSFCTSFTLFLPHSLSLSFIKDRNIAVPSISPSLSINLFPWYVYNTCISLRIFSFYIYVYIQFFVES